MAAPKRTELERAEQLPEIERMYSAGFSPREIGARFDLSARVVRRDLETIEQRYRDAELSERVAGVRRTIAALRDVRRESWETWQRSKKDRVRHVEKKVGDTIRTTIITGGRLPDSKYIGMILRTVHQEAMLLGLYAPMQDVPTHPHQPRRRIDKRGLESLANQPAEVEPNEPTRPEAEPGAA